MVTQFTTRTSLGTAAVPRIQLLSDKPASTDGERSLEPPGEGVSSPEMRPTLNTSIRIDERRLSANRASALMSAQSVERQAHSRQRRPGLALWLTAAAVLAMGLVAWVGYGAASGSRTTPLGSTTNALPTPMTTGNPPARMDAMMTYDAHDGYVLLFGGTNVAGNEFGDTWTYKAGTWTKLTLATHPQARDGGYMTYDAKDGYVVLFGGCGPVTCPLGDTWKFVGGHWTQLFPTKHPSPRIGGSLAYDAKDGYAVLFGGTNAHSSVALGDTWKFVGGAWTQLTTTMSPPARFQGMMTYDTLDGYVLLFGGTNVAGTEFGDTWTFSGGAWTKLSLTNHPVARDSAMMTYDPKDSYVVLFGGGTASGDSATTWKFASGAWTQLFPSTHPSARDSGVMAYDAADSYAVLFGGSNTSGTTAYGDSWGFVTGGWTKL